MGNELDDISLPKVL
ncbi:hypothetical protein HG535_0D04540 [Zygotorulaspora mrakii]|uniref:Uncharacterized protein n=1 Tax=Zygotorulaspora mrakii TaxID=42260 RepID=A0A7H9B268_ZYGMR|nr:hypothetical protein HG535_0D04540 [Zygotorulaspora mrakii]